MSVAQLSGIARVHWRALGQEIFCAPVE